MVNLLTVLHLGKTFRVSVGAFQSAILRALDEVNFQLESGKTLGIVGESGSGKSTLARCILRLIEPDTGEISFDGVDLLAASGSRLRELRRKMAIVFQDPYLSLNPRMKIGEAIAEPMEIQGDPVEPSGIRHLLSMVGLHADDVGKYPHELSGGQRQRVAIARALSLHPALLILDEPTSALDVSMQAGILNLLRDLKDALGATYIFISHNLNVVRYMSDRIAVMYRGRIVEAGDATIIFENPQHEYTQRLLAATRPSTPPLP